MSISIMTTTCDAGSASTPLTLSAVDSRAKTSASPEAEQDSQGLEVGCGLSTSGLLAIYDHASSSWKMLQLSLFEGWAMFSGTWPDSGMTCSGRLFQRAPWVAHICDDACSLWPTPTASMDGRGFGIPLHARSGRYKSATVLRVQELVIAHGWRIHPNFTETLMGFPTDWSAIAPLAIASIPTSRNGSRGASVSQRNNDE